MPTPIEQALVLKPTLPMTIVYDVADIVPPTSPPDYIYQVAHIWDRYSSSYGIWIALEAGEGSGFEWYWREGRRAAHTSQTSVFPYGRGEYYFNLAAGTIYQSIDGSNWLQIG
jgi:hypothetical protein